MTLSDNYSDVGQLYATRAVLIRPVAVLAPVAHPRGMPAPCAYRVRVTQARKKIRGAAKKPSSLLRTRVWPVAANIAYVPPTKA